MDIVPGLPRVMFDPKVFPFYQIPELPVDDFTVQDFFDNPFFFSFDDLWERQRWNTSPFNQVNRGWREFDYIEDWVQATHGRWEFQPICIVSDLLFNWEGA